MLDNPAFLLRQAQSVAQSLSYVAIISLTAFLIFASGLALLGQMPWPNLPLAWGPVALPQAGMWVQLGLTLLMICICFFLPANARMARLEKSHRTFQINMEDVKRAYALAHAADRTGVFSLSTEFEAMRQRMELLRKHPDLSQLEPELLELAAQMSFQSRDLARAYSEDKVGRARAFLTARQTEADAMAERIKLARMICDELRRWLEDVEAEERRNHDQIKRLEADLREVLPSLGYDFEDPREANVVALPKPAVKSDGLH
ncbi:DNA repair protein [Gemmobacter fulvus]|uniref:DNA repair protein n=1 Tax=Gemmobacter fulvus TaxID=2840474 RepID=UPI00279667C4|nr:DNA repair protein [Gemmobacter fulvus]MDQ1848082.1 DNA repair protein [Gemmobacter fulvus]